MSENSGCPSDREIFDKIAGRIARSIDKAARQKSITISLVDCCDEDYMEEAFGAQADFADGLPREFPQEIAGMETDRPENSHPDSIEDIIRKAKENRSR